MSASRFLVLAVLLCITLLTACRAAATETPEATTSTPAPAQTPLPTDTPEPAATPVPAWPNDFVLGVPYSDIAAVDPALLRSMGVTWVWTQRQDYSAPVNAVHALGFRLMVVAAGDRARLSDAAYQQEYVSGLAAMAAQGADAIVVMSGDLNVAMVTPAVAPADYTALLCSAYTAIKEASPAALVISAPPANTGMSGGGTMPGDVWLAGLYAAGAAECLDYVGVSFLQGTTAPGESTGGPFGDHYSGYFWPLVTTYSAAFANSRPLAFVSFGYPSGDGLTDLSPITAWAGENTLDEQADWTAEAVTMSANSGSVAAIMFWQFKAPYADCDQQPFCPSLWALMRSDGSCPACDALRAALEQGN